MQSSNVKFAQIGGAAAAAPVKVNPATGVEFALESLDTGIYGLRDALDVLCSRLAIVSRPPTEADAESPVIWPECVSPLEDGLYNRASLIYQQVARCKSLLDRLST